MAASYPSGVKAFTTKNNGDTVQAAHVDDLQDEVTAIENALINGIAHAVSITGALSVTGAITASGSLTFGNTLTGTALAQHTFGSSATGINRVVVTNTTAGTGNAAGVRLTNDTASGHLVLTSSTYSTARSATADPINVAGSLQIFHDTALLLAAPNGSIQMYAGGNTSPSLRTQLTSTGLLEHNAAFALSGIVSTTQIVANTDNYAPANFSISTWLRMASDAARNLTGLAGGATGRMVFMSNQGSFTITLKHESASSTAANRIQCPGAVDYSLTTAKSVILYYDSTAARWYVVGA